MAEQPVLFIAYYYPLPSSSESLRHARVGGERVYRFVKYLPRHGFVPYVLTSSRWGQSTDHRIRAVKERFRGENITGSRRRTTPRVSSDSPRMKSFFRTHIKRLVFPDRLTYTWSPFAIREGIKLIREHKIRILFSSYPPIANHFIGHVLARITGLPWVADYRDGYVLEPPHPEPGPAWLRKWFEQQLLSRANALISVSRLVADDLAARLPHLPITIIPNGFDPDDIRRIPLHCPPSNTFTIFYGGGFSSSRSTFDPLVLLNGFKKFIEACQAYTRAQLIIMGHLTPDELNRITAFVQRYPIILSPWRAKHEFYQAVSRAHVTVLMAGHHKTVVSSKLFDYIALQKPILVLGDTSEAAQYVKDLRLGLAVPCDPSSVSRALIGFYNQWLEGDLSASVDATPILRFSRPFQAAQLAQIFNSMITPSR